MSRPGRHRMSATKPLVTVLVPAGDFLVGGRPSKLGLKGADRGLNLPGFLPYRTGHPVNLPEFVEGHETIHSKTRSLIAIIALLGHDQSSLD